MAAASSFLAHTAWLCFAFGAVLCSICPAVDNLLSANVRTKESQLMTRHFGIALLLVGGLCLTAAARSGISQDDLAGMLVVWHAAVVAAFVVEFAWVGAFRDAPAPTRLLARMGAVVHAAILLEGVDSTMSADSEAGNIIRDNFNSSLGSFVGLGVIWRDAALAYCSSRGAASACLCVIIPLIMLTRSTKRFRRGNAQDESFDGDLVVITGAAGGIGREIALAFARRGARLALWDIREEALKETVAWLESQNVNPSNVTTMAVDVSEASDVATAAESLRKAEGGRAPRVVVSNAAVMRGKSLLDSADDEIRRDFSVNTLAAFWVLRAFLRQMFDEQSRSCSGRTERVLVTIGSIMAELPAHRQAEYCASKAALSQLHECLRWELKRTGPGASIRTLLVQPYAVNTRMISGAALLGEGSTSAHRRFALMRRVLPPLEPADAARRVVEAVQNGDERVYIPRIVGWLPLILNVLPTFASDGILGLVGALDGTDGFCGCAPMRPGAA